MLPGDLARTITDGQAFGNPFIASRQPFVQPAVEIEAEGDGIGWRGVLRVLGDCCLPTTILTATFVIQRIDLEAAELLCHRRKHIVGTLPRNKPAGLHAKHSKMGYLSREQPWVLASIDQPDDRDHGVGCCFGNGFRPGIVAEMSEGGIGVGFDGWE